MGISKIDTRANWAALNPTLLSGETGFESDTGNEKVGNGKSARGISFSTSEALDIGETFQMKLIKLQQRSIHRMQ
jgi:hypothetical protein